MTPEANNESFCRGKTRLDDDYRVMRKLRALCTTETIGEIRGVTYGENGIKTPSPDGVLSGWLQY